MGREARRTSKAARLPDLKDRSGAGTGYSQLTDIASLLSVG